MLDQLHHFTLVAAHGTFTAAARHAHITQPALTASIQRLEALLGARLLVRGRGSGAGSRATLTAAGEALLPRARAALAAVEDGCRAVAEVTGLTAGQVRLGAGATVCTYYLPKILARFRARHPHIRIHLREGAQEALLDDLEGGELDLLVLARTGRGFTEGLGAVSKTLVRERWLDDELVLVAAPDVEPSDAPLVTFARGGTTRTLVDRHFPERPIAMELGSIASVKGNVRAGVGIALVSRRAAARDVATGQLVEVPSDRTPIVRPLYLVHRGRDRLPPAAAALHAMLRDRALRA